MSPLASKLALAGAFAAKVYAHGLVQGIGTDGTYNQGFILDYYYAKINSGTYPATAGWYEEATDNGYVAPSAYGESDIICHKNAENAKDTISVAAGGTVDFYWTTWPDSHIGPILTYVANCGTGTDACSTVDKTTLKFVKIDEAGIDLDTQTWPTETMIANNNTYSVTVPSTLAAGNYVFRHEIIAMHGAGSVGGAQNYPFCMNIAITGGGSDSPEGTLGTALYTETGTYSILHVPLRAHKNTNMNVLHRPWHLLQPLHHPDQLHHPRPRSVLWRQLLWLDLWLDFWLHHRLQLRLWQLGCPHQQRCRDDDGLRRRCRCQRHRIGLVLDLGLQLLLFLFRGGR